MFRGINVINLDAKGRMAMPARYRELLDKEARGKMVATIDTEQRCLLLYPFPEWEKIEQKLITLPSFDVTTRRIQRLLIGHATELELDNANRVLLPQELRDYAKLKKRLALIGQGKRLEIWNDDHWNAQRKVWIEEHLQDRESLPEMLRTLTV